MPPQGILSCSASLARHCQGLAEFSLRYQVVLYSDIANMVSTTSVSLLCSALVGLSSAAGAGSKEEYASGAVHHRIMEIKMVSRHAFCHLG